jgi:isopenicillin-N N-acyltransferase like protein
MTEEAMSTSEGDTMATYPHVRVSGSPYERAVSYGRQARERVERSVEGYARVFSTGAGLGWPAVRELAKRYEDPVGAFEPSYLEELRGIADGAGLDFLDTLALNVRTEIMFSAKARDAAATLRAAECTSFALVPAPGESSSPVIGQNWDWLVHCFDTVVVLESESEDRLNFVTVVEAGLLAKMGMNAAGLGLATNALVTEADKGEPGVPFHVLLRAILDCESVTEALATLQRGRRSSSANYLVVHEDGSALDVEAAPGDYSTLFLVDAPGPFLHTNHFISDRFDGRDVSLWAMPDSAVRLGRVRAAARNGARLDPKRMMTLMADHAGFPDSVCCHPNPSHALEEQGATIASVIMEPRTRTMWLADGQPCTRPFRRLDYAEFLKAPSSLTPG